MTAEPTLRIGLGPPRPGLRITIEATPARVIPPGGEPLSLPPGTRCEVRLSGGEILLESPGTPPIRGTRLRVEPTCPHEGALTVAGVSLGIDFHWQQQQDLSFRGILHLLPAPEASDRIQVINEVPLETYLESVISSEMSARAPAALLEAHAIISRSWLLAQLDSRPGTATAPAAVPASVPSPDADGIPSLDRWYDREDHAHYDVCADDHCQRYQGITRATTPAALAAVSSTRGRVLVDSEGKLVDARFSKCCGGYTERFTTAWGGGDPSCLEAVYDGPGNPPFSAPLTTEPAARPYLEGTPPAWCNTSDRALLERVLPEIDHRTRDFYRWDLTLDPTRAGEVFHRKSGVDLGPLTAIVPLARGPSGRLFRVEFRGRRGRLRVGRELEIRRLLHPSHLYSSAFMVNPMGEDPNRPRALHLRGAGWGHGVGLCQIGAAVMAHRGHTAQAVLAHYYRHSTLDTRYL